MPNPNYRKGRRKEYSVIDKLRADFDIIQRSKGSHSPIDIFAINKTTKEILLIQVKPDNISSKQFADINKENKDLNNSFKVRFEIM